MNIYKNVLLDVGHNDFQHKLPRSITLIQAFNPESIVGKVTNLVKVGDKLFGDIKSDHYLDYMYPAIGIEKKFIKNVNGLTYKLISVSVSVLPNVSDEVLILNKYRYYPNAK